MRMTNTLAAMQNKQKRYKKDVLPLYTFTLLTCVSLLILGFQYLFGWIPHFASIKELRQNQFRVSVGDVICKEYKVMDRWYNETASVPGMYGVYAYYHIRLSDGNIISLRLPASMEISDGMLLRGRIDEISKELSETELKSCTGTINELFCYQPYLFTVEHSQTLYRAAGVLLLLSGLSVAVIFGYIVYRVHLLNTLNHLEESDYENG